MDPENGEIKHVVSKISNACCGPTWVKGFSPCGSGFPAAMIEVESLSHNEQIQAQARVKSRIKM
jgi:hypothetical protein